MATVDFTARFVGAGRVAVQLRRAADAVDAETREAVREAGEESVFIFAVKAPKGRTRRLSKGIRSRVRGGTATVVSTARSREGFAYTGVTRFGHRVRFIRPRHAAPEGRYIAPIPGVGPRWVAKTAALRFRIGNRVVFRAKVRGYRPTHDWAEDALPAAERTVVAAGTRAGRRIVARVGA